MSRKLIKRSESCDLKAAPFDLVKGLSEAVVKKEVATALRLFTMLPCPETAIILLELCPEMSKVMILANGSFVRMTPEEYRGPALQGFEQWIERFDSNLRLVSALQLLLLKKALNGKVEIGFHGIRDQSPLYHRLNHVGIRKRFFADRRQFLRDEITKNLSAFRAVIDMICIETNYLWDGGRMFPGSIPLMFHIDKFISLKSQGAGFLY